MKTRLVGFQRIRSCALSILLVTAAIIGLPVLSARAAPVDCLPIQQTLVKIPEIVTDGAGHLRGTVLLNDQEERVASAFRWAGETYPARRTRSSHAFLSSCELIRLAARPQRAGVWLTRCPGRRCAPASAISYN